MFVLRMVYAAFISPCLPVLDTLTLIYLEDDKESFGHERLWGAVSWALSHLLMGVLMDYTGSWVMYPAVVLSCALFVGAVQCAPPKPK